MPTLTVMDDASLGAEEIIIFTVGDEKFGVSRAAVENVEDICAHAEFPTIDLRQKFGYSQSSLRMKGRLLVLRHGDQVLGFEVDRLIAFEIMNEQTDLKRSGYAVMNIDRELIRGVIFRCQDQVKVLDVAKLFRFADGILKHSRMSA